MTQSSQNLLVGIVIVGLVLIGSVLLSKAQSTTPTLSVDSTTPVPSGMHPNSPTPLSFSQLYTDPKYKFSFSYPATWNATSSDSNNKQVHTITLKSPSNFLAQATIGPSSTNGQCDTDTNKDLGYDVLLVNNRTFYIHFNGDKSANTITNAYITQQTTPCPNFPFISMPLAGTSNSSVIQVQLMYGERIPTQQTDFQGQDYQTAKYILSTLAL